MILHTGGERTVHLYRLLALVVVTLPLMDLEVFRLAGRSIVVSYITVGMLGAAVLGTPGVAPRFLRSDWALPFLLAWLLLAAVSSALAFFRTQQLPILYANTAQWAGLSLMVAHYVVIGSALRDQPPDALERLVSLFVATATAGGVLSLYQVGSVVFGLPYVDLLRTSNLYHHINTLNWHGGGSWISLPRAFGAAPEPTFWAGYLAVGLALAVGRLARPLRLTPLAQILVITAGLVSTFARAALPSVVAVMACWVVVAWRPRTMRWIGPAIVTTAFAGTVWPALVGDRWLTVLMDHSAIERLSSTITGMRIVADHPIAGIGPGSVPFVVERYIFVIEGRQSVGFQYLYSFLASVLASTGILGGVLFAGFLVETGRRLYWVSQTRSVQQLTLAKSAFLAFVCIVVYWIGSAAYNMSFLWFCHALSAGLPGRGAPPDAPCAESV